MAGADILPFKQPLATNLPLLLDLSQDVGSGAADAQFSLRLHRQLEIQSLLEQFVIEVREMHPIAGICHTVPESGEIHVAGTGGRATVSTRLSFDGHDLGQVEVHLTADLKTALQRVLEPLAAPLYNALCHHRLKLLACMDPLTGLGNRMAMDSLLATEVARAHRFGHAFTMLIVDIDLFKGVNDTLGHSVGDQVIRSVAQNIRECLRPYDQAFRYGGEEFVVVLSQTTLAKGMHIAERIRRRVQSRCKIDADPARRITVSIGGGEYQRHEMIDQLFNRADRALYDAKNGGRNRVIAAGAA